MRPLPDVPHFSRDGVTLYNGCALALLPRLRGVADLVVTDPPYRLSSGGRNAQVMSGIFASDRYDNSGELMRTVRWDQFARPLLDACRPDADAYVMANDKQVFAAHAAMTGAGWRLHNLLVWNKGAPTRNRWYMKENEYVLYLWKGRARTIRNPGSKQTFIAPRPDRAEKIHDTQKPVPLLEHYIRNSSAPGGLVLDPFAGSAATLIAALRSGRRAVGFEIDVENYRAAVARLERECEKQSVFPEGG
jgi:site-specific DNA-methyltransferase (adenine-specific)